MKARNRIGKTSYAAGISLAAILIGLLSGKLFAALVNSQVPKSLPHIEGDAWLNSRKLKLHELKGKVVLVEFWTYACYNCHNVEPYIKSWHSKYASQGLLTLAVHTPEFDYERDINNVQSYLIKKRIQHPVIIDNSTRIWNSFNNRYWPVIYLFDKKGQLRYQQIGEGRYELTEQWINTLLEEA